MIKVAVVILNWNGSGYIKRFLPGVIQHSVTNEFKVFVADNGSTDDSIELLETMLDHEYIIRLEKNFGYARGYAYALSKIDARYYILLNSDVEVTENWIDPVIQYMDSLPDVGACMPKIKSYAKKDDFEYAGSAGGFIDIFGYPFCRGRILNHIERDEGQYNDSTEIFWASGACMFVSKDAYVKAGGLDRDFFAHMEEIDLCWRLKNAGYSIRYISSSEVYHVGGGTLPNNNPRKLYLNYRNNLFLLYKNLPKKYLYRILVARFLMDNIAALVFLTSFSFSFFVAIYKAYASFLFHLNELKRKRKALLEHTQFKMHPEIFRGSILWSFFVKRKKHFSQLRFK